MRAVKCPVFINGKQLNGPLTLDIDFLKINQKYVLPVQMEPPKGYDEFEGKTVLVEKIEKGVGSDIQRVYYFSTLD